MFRRPMNAHRNIASARLEALSPGPTLPWQIATVLAFAVPFVVCLIKFDVNVALGVFMLTYFIVSIIASLRAAQITRRLRMNENEFVQVLHQQLASNPQNAQDHSSTVHLYLSLLDRDFGENDYELLSILDEVTEKVGASNEQIKSIQSKKWKEKCSVSQCPVCLESFSTKDLIKKLPCCHIYHADCIDQWLSRKSNCPVCKDEVFCSKPHNKTNNDEDTQRA